MNFTEQIERISKVHNLILAEETGSAKTLAAKLQISVDQLYNDLEFFKQMKTEVKYSVKKETFYYISNNLDFVTI